MEILTSDNSLVISNQALGPSPPPREHTNCCNSQVLVLPRVSLGQPAASSMRWPRLNTRGEACPPSHSLTSAYATAAEVGEDVGLNTLGTGTGSPGFNY